MNMGTDVPGAGFPPVVSSPQAPQEEGFSLHLDLARSLRMRRGLAIAVALATLLALIPLALTRKPAFQATSIIYVAPVISKTPTDLSGNYDSSTLR